MEPNSIQKRMQEMQKNDEKIANLFGKLVSGKSGYKAVIERNKPIPRCSNCNLPLTGDEKFCPECGRAIARDIAKS